MQPSAKQCEILRATAAFAGVERYQGTLPKRQALLFARTDMAALEDSGFLELVKLSFPCGKAIDGWRLTETGREWLIAQGWDDGELAPEHLRLLNDVYHYSRISRYRGMMPKEYAKDYDADDLRDLFEHGYLLRIQIKGTDKTRGWLLSAKGLTALRLIRETGTAACRRPAPSSETTSRDAPARDGAPAG